MNAKYTISTLKDAKKALEEQGYVMIPNIFSTEEFTEVIEETARLPFTHNVNPLRFNTHKAQISGKIQTVLETLAPLAEVFDIKPTYTAQHVLWKSYSILSDDDIEEGTHVFIELSTIPDDAGGATYFINDDEDDSFFVPTIANSITIVKAAGLRSFLKYTNHYIKETSGRLFLFGVSK
jgi:hypothetical protein